MKPAWYAILIDMILVVGLIVSAYLIDYCTFKYSDFIGAVLAIITCYSIWEYIHKW